MTLTINDFSSACVWEDPSRPGTKLSEKVLRYPELGSVKYGKRQDGEAIEIEIGGIVCFKAGFLETLNTDHNGGD